MTLIKLNNGYEIPQVGLGTWRLNDNTKLRQIMLDAIEIGYRHFDCALVYENEAMVGEILQEIYSMGKVKREDLFITSKLWNAHHGRAECALKKTLKDLRTDYLDLYLIHWPVCFGSNEDGETIWIDGKPDLKPYDIEELWPQLESFVDQGLVRSIGVANHGIENIKIILGFCKIKPAMCQVEINPFWLQKDLISFCRENDIAVTSYSSLGSMKTSNEPQLMENDLIMELAHSKNLSVPQLILGWLRSQNIVVIPKASSYERLKQNFEAVSIDEEDARNIENTNITHKFVDLPEFGPDRFK